MLVREYQLQQAKSKLFKIDGIIEEARRDAVAEVDPYEAHADFDSHMRSGVLCDLIDGRVSEVVTSPRTG